MPPSRKSHKIESPLNNPKKMNQEPNARRRTQNRKAFRVDFTAMESCRNMRRLSWKPEPSSSLTGMGLLSGVFGMGGLLSAEEDGVNSFGMGESPVLWKI